VKLWLRSKELYGADVSASIISIITDSVIEQVVEWQSRSLDSFYPIVYLDCIILKIRQDKLVINKAVYLALVVNMEVRKSYWTCEYLKMKALSSGLTCD